MKKSIIAAGAASVALAAMPIVGVFAVDPATVDVVTATINNGCLMTDSVVQKPVDITVAPGNVATSTAAGSISVTCNTGGWHISALGGTVATPSTTLVGTNSSSNTIATGTAVSGPTSNWAFRVDSLKDSTTGTDIPPATATIASGTNPDYDYSEFSAVPGSATTIVNILGYANMTVNTQYQVYAALSQPADVYVGRVTYTVAENS